MDIITVYINKRSYNGYITIDAWHSKDQQYPLLWHNKFLDYTIKEIKDIVKNRIADKCKEYNYSDNYKIEYITV